jgi:hypothetical protein
MTVYEASTWVIPVIILLAPVMTTTLSLIPCVMAFLVSPPILLVAHLLHPVDDVPVELFLNGDMRHGRGCRGSACVSGDRK